MAYITLNKKSFFNNLDIIAKHTKTKDKIALVLKDNAYGHGIQEIAVMAKEYGIKKVVVQCESEAKILEDYFEYILVLADTPHVKSSKKRYTINDIKSINKFPSGTLVELKVDTGMHRNGISMHELRESFIKIKESGLILEAVFTHHRSADKLSSEWFWQNDNFKVVKQEASDLAEEFGFSPLRFHSANSAALFRSSDFSEDMARVGIASYGCMELPPSLHVNGFKPILSLYANKVSSRELKRGECVGYGATFEAKEDCVVSNYDFGYGDGFLRVLSNNYKTPSHVELVGRISMDNSSFLSDEDELLVFDDASVVAQMAETIGYEVLTSLKSDIRREIISGDVQC